MLASFPKVPNT